MELRYEKVQVHTLSTNIISVRIFISRKEFSLMILFHHYFFYYSGLCHRSIVYIFDYSTLLRSSNVLHSICLRSFQNLSGRFKEPVCYNLLLKNSAKSLSKQFNRLKRSYFISSFSHVLMNVCYHHHL